MDALPGVTPAEGGLSRFVDATVVSVDPLLVRRDGDEAGLEALSLVDPATLVVDDRVRCELDARRVIIHGRAGGAGMRRAFPTKADLDAFAGWPGLQGYVVSENRDYVWSPYWGSPGWNVTDTGWVTITDFGPGMSAGPTVPAARRNHETVYLMGRIDGPITTGTLLCKLPPGFRPMDDRVRYPMGFTSSNTSTGRMELLPNGDLTVPGVNASVTYVYLDHVSYLLG